MSVIKVPVLCWRVTDDLVCAHAVGSGLEVVRADEKKATAALSSELARGDHVIPELTEVRLVRRTLTLRPSYRVDGEIFPLPQPMEIAVDAVFGRNDYGSYSCYLPRLDTRFQVYEPGTLNTLLDHFATDELRAMTPEQLIRHGLPGEPWLATLTVKPKKARRSRGPEIIPTPRLSKVADKLPRPKRSTGPGALPAAAWERAREVSTCQDLLGRVHLMVVGEHGVGKSAILGEAIRKRARRKDGPTFWISTAHRLVAGSRYLGDWQQAVDQLTDDLQRVRGVLRLDDLAALVQVGGGSPADSVAAYLIPAMDRGELHLVGEVTPRVLDALRTALPGFVERFRQVRVSPLSEARVQAILTRYGRHLDEKLDLTLEPPARRMTYRLMARHVRQEHFPAKALKFLSQAAQQAVLAERTTLSEADVMAAFIEQTGMPRVLVDDRTPLDADAVEAFFTERIVGQPAAVEAVTRAIHTFKAGLNDPDKPLATLLFSGPTGVGKTALAAALADFCFGEGRTERPLIRIDMSEFQHPGQLDRLIGTVDGEPGELVRKVRANPFGVVLFDEIEKASPVFFDTLLTVLDEGILADAAGRLTDFRSSFVIMTTNLGARRGRAPGFDSAPDPSALSDIKAFFRPEFFNRIDQVVPFQSLDADVIRAITRLELDRVREREGLTDRRLALRYTDALVAVIAARGYDEAYGARALQRVVEHQVVAALASWMLANPDVQDVELVVDVLDGAIAVRRY